MLRVNRDPTGDLARLKCDECRRVSGIFLVGPMPDHAAVRDQLREICGENGWRTMPALDGELDVRIDLCPRCCRKANRNI